MVPFVKESSFQLRGGCGVAQEKSEPMYLRAWPVSLEETKTIKTKDAEAEADKSARTGGAGGTNLGAADSLRDGTRALASPTVAFRVGARMA